MEFIRWSDNGVSRDGHDAAPIVRTYDGLTGEYPQDLAARMAVPERARTTFEVNRDHRRYILILDGQSRRADLTGEVRSVG